MNNRVHKLSARYVALLGRYLERHQESLLQDVYELGRHAIANGLGLLEMARIHQQALAVCLSRAYTAEQTTRTLAAAEILFMETLSPFEAAHRGFCAANLELHQLNAKLERRNAELAAVNLDLRDLSHRVLHAQEAERKHISRELHDEIGQALTAINTNLGMLQRHDPGDAKLRDQRITDTLTLLAHTMKTVHSFARELRPAILDQLGLVPALRSYTHDFAERTGLRVRFTGNDDAEQLNDAEKTVVFRVAQESLTNVAKHARASRVAVSLRKTADGLQMQIKDNGRAFDVDEQLSAGGRRRLGLVGMQERVRLINGRFTVRSAPGKGTTVSVDIPFQTRNAQAA